jgi:hypothetical protein
MSISRGPAWTRIKINKDICPTDISWVHWANKFHNFFGLSFHIIIIIYQELKGLAQSCNHKKIHTICTSQLPPSSLQNPTNIHDFILIFMFRSWNQ